MFLPISLPRGVALTDIRRLQSHAAWYHREAVRHGPGFGVLRFMRARKRRLRQIDAVALATARIGSAL